MTKDKSELADAYPRKRFFLEMFTRDISLEDCLLDLIDNSIDSLIRHSKNEVVGKLLDKDAPLPRKPLPEVIVVANPKEVSVADTCGGIPKETALHDMFCFGHPEGHDTGYLGVYGIGLKRAIFKIGNAFEMESKTEKDGFEVQLDVNKWAEKDESLEDWRIPLQFTMGSGNAKTAGTTIRFTDLRPEVKMRLKDGSLEASLRKSISQAYAFFLEKYVRITINEKTVEPMPVPLGDSSEIEPANVQIEDNGVKIRLFASLMPKDKWSYDRAGWYVLCNGRVVLAADKSDVTGWGNLKMPLFHSKYLGFIGIALLESGNALSLPWTTTKRGLNRESPVYQTVRREMVSISKPILAFMTKMYPTELTENPVEREVASRVKPADLRVVAARTPTGFTTSHKKATKTTTRVQYDAEVRDIDRIRKHLRRPGMGANRIGSLTFEYYLERECGK